MGIRDDIRIGKLYPPEPDMPEPSSPLPEGCERVRISARRWRVFRKASAFELRYGRELTYSIDDEPDPEIRRVIDEEGARPTSLIPVHRPVTRDPLLDLQLLRDLKVINERTVKELGPLPRGGLPVQEKRKPASWRADAPALERQAAETDATNEEDAMKLAHLAATAALAASTLSGCSDPDHPSRNPHPTQRYEVTITADAPGAWDEVKTSVRYEVTNLDCTPKAPVFFGGHTGVPIGQWEHIDVTQVSENIWRGYFYRDLLRDEDYYGLGACRWDGTQISASFFAHSVRFGTGQFVGDAMERPQTRFFRKSDFLNSSVDVDTVRDFDEADPDIRNFNDFFSISVTVKEAKL